MKKHFSLFLSLYISSILLVSCSTEDDKTPSVPTYGNLVSFQANILGGQTNSTLGSFYCISEDSVYFKSGADANPGKIDLIYYFGSTSGDSSVLCAATDPVFNLPSDQTPFTSVKNWSTKNNTNFLKLSISENLFNSLSNDSLLLADLDSNVITTKVSKLTVGDIVGFKTATGRLGIYHVKAINNTNALTRSITIDLKVQE